MRPEPSLLASAVSEFRRGFRSIVLFSAVVNILMLAGPLYMLQVYDRVLTSYSVPTLVGLTVLLVAVYVFQAALEIVRTRIVNRLARQFDQRLEASLHQLVISEAVAGRSQSALQPLRDVDQLRGFLLGPGPIAIVDAPWVPVFIVICFLVHPVLGYLGLAGAVVLVGVTILAERASRTVSKELSEEAAARTLSAEASRRGAESVVAMGMGANLSARWAEINGRYAGAQQRAQDISGGYGAVTRIFRLLLQSAVLGLGAYLAIYGEISTGAMIAVSIMIGRALAPVEMLISQWRNFVAARQSLHGLRGAYANRRDDATAMQLPNPGREIAAENLVVAAPGTRAPILVRCDFTVAAGEAVAIIGASGSGKSSLGRTLVGLWPALMGNVRLDGAALDQWPAERLGRHVGYVSQAIDLFDGTVAENIARLEPSPDSAAVVAAAEAAGAHAMILGLKAGYDTRIGEAGAILSAGQRQRIALARALYRDPALLVLDEPNSNLDNPGETALLQAIRRAKERGAMVAVITHRPTLLAVCDLVLYLAEGTQKAFGRRDDVLPRILGQAQRPQVVRSPASEAELAVAR